ncbi:MAG: GspMb/PilO family protein [Thermoanaerobaculia bacterium]
MIWREKRILLIVLGLLLVANTVFFFTYRVQYKERLDALDFRLDQTKAQLQEARRSRMATEAQVAAYRRIEQDVQQIFNERWATESERFTRLVTEVKRLAMAANLSPATMSYTRTEVKGGRARPGARTTSTGATEVGVNFAVQGTYQQIRRLINMLELSEHFVIIDQIDLSSSDGETLNMNLRIKTLFRDTSVPAGTVSNRQL